MAWDPEADQWDDDKYWADRNRREEAARKAQAREVERWFKRRVAQIIGLHRHYTHKSPEHREGMLEWYWQERSQFLGWRDFDAFTGPGYAAGEFVTFDKAIMAAAPFAVRWDNTLDGLEYFLRWELQRPAAEQSASPVEPSGFSVLQGRGHSASAVRLSERSHRIHRSRPRPCGDCGEEFRPQRKGSSRCAKCRDAKAEARRRKKEG